MNVEIISSPTFPTTMGPYSQATRAGQFIFCAGQGGVDPATGKLVVGGIREQSPESPPAFRQPKGRGSKPQRPGLSSTFGSRRPLSKCRPGLELFLVRPVLAPEACQLPTLPRASPRHSPVVP